MKITKPLFVFFKNNIVQVFDVELVCFFCVLRVSWEDKLVILDNDVKLVFFLQSVIQVESHDLVSSSLYLLPCLVYLPKR